MSLIGEIDLTLMPQDMEILLAKPNFQIIANLKEAYNKKLNVTMSGINEVEFDLPYKIDKGHKLIDNPNISLLRDRYLLKIIVDGKEDWYTIRNISDVGEEDSEHKPVKAYLLPYEMNDKLIEVFEEDALTLEQVLMGGTVVDSAGGVRDVDGILKSYTKWQVGYVDADFITTQRSFNFSSTTVLDALNQVAETFKAVMEWDTVNRVINFWNPDNYGLNKGLTIGYGKYLQTVSRESNSDEMTTRLIVTGADDLSIQRLNPSGQRWLDDFSFFMYPFQRNANKDVLQSSYYMSDELCNAILDYNEFADSKKGILATYLDQKSSNEAILDIKNNDMATLQEQIAVIKNNIDLANSNMIDPTLPTTNEQQFFAANLPVTFITTDTLKITSSTVAINNLNFAENPAQDFISSIKVGTAEIFSNNKTAWSTGKFNGTLSIPVGANVFITFKKNYTYSDKTKIQYRKTGDTTYTDMLLDASPVAMSKISVVPALIDQLNAKQAEIDAKQAEIDALNVIEDGIQANIDALRASLDASNFFTDELQLELVDYIIVKEWNDQNYINDEELYEDAIKYFEKLKTPQIVVEIDIVNFLQIVEAQRDWGRLALGDTINIRYDRIGVNVEAKVIGYEIDFESKSIKLTIANTKDIMTDEDKLFEAIYKSTGTSTTVDLNRFKWDDAVATASEVSQIIDGQWDAIKRSIVAGINNSVEIGERGILVKSSTDPNSYLIINNGLLAITNDQGNTWKHAITATGIVGERIYGKLLAGTNLIIDASDSTGKKTFTVDSTGVKILGTSLIITGGLPTSQLDPAFKDSLVNLGTAYNGVVINTASGLVITKSDNSVRTLLNATDGLKFQKAASGGTWTDQFYYDVPSGNLVLNGQLNAKSIKINGVEVIAGGLISGTMIDKLSVNKLDVSTAKITTAMIETLTVGTNVTMGANAVIQWAQVSGAPTASWTNPSYITTTKITQTSIESPNIAGGTITGVQIFGGTITSNTTIDVGTDLKVGNNIYLGKGVVGSKYVIFNSSAQIYSTTSTSLNISAETTNITDGNVYIGSSASAYSTNFIGIVNFGGATVNGITAKFA
jgi:hypothetical protein